MTSRKLQLALALNRAIIYALAQGPGMMNTYRVFYGGGELFFYDVAGMRRRMKQILSS